MNEPVVLGKLHLRAACPSDDLAAVVKFHQTPILAHQYERLHLGTRSAADERPKREKKPAF